MSVRVTTPTDRDLNYIYEDITSVKNSLKSASTVPTGVGANEVPLNAYLGALAYADNIVITKDDVGLGSADNTSDADKPISTAMQAALDLKVALREGYALSKNDFSDALKVKLEGITPTDYVQTWTLGALAYRDSINYAEIEGTPVIPVQVKANWQTTATDDLSYIQNKPNLATVATSGAYADLQGKPNLAAYAEEWKLGAFAYRDGIDYAEISNTPAPQVNADWNSVATDSPARILNKPSLATIATSGLYGDLQGTPDLSVYARRWEMGALAYRDNIDYSEISNTPTIPAAPVQSNWNTTASSDLSYIVNKPTLGTAASLNTGTASGNVPVLDASGKLNTSVLPSLSITDIYAVTALTDIATGSIQKGDVAIVTSVRKSYIWDGTAWQELLTPTDAVTSVAGKTGVVTLTKSDVGLNLVDNTSDVGKPLSTAMIAALSAKQDIWALGALAFRDGVDYTELSSLPTKLSEFTNDSNFLTSTTLSITTDKLPTIPVSKLATLTTDVIPSLPASRITGLGTASAKDIPAIGNASTTQVVFGNDTRLSDSRPASDVAAWAKASVRPTYTASDVGLGSVNNTSDADKPISAATASALQIKQDTWMLGAFAYRDSIDYTEVTNTPATPVQSNWAQVATDQLDYIKNKPVNLSQFTNNSGFLTANTLTTDVLPSIPPSKLLTLTTDKLPSIPSSKLEILTTDKLPSIPSSKLQALTTDLLPTIPASKLASLTTDKLPSIPPSKLQTLTTDLLPTIPVSKLATLTSDVIPSLPTSKITGLGTAATKNIPASGDAGTTEVVLGSDSRLTKPVDVSWAFGAMAYRDTIEYSELSGQPTLGTAASKNTGTGNDNVPLLDSLGKLSSNVIPFGTTNSSVAYGDHTHTAYAAVGHTHSAYAASDHTHSGYLSAVPTAADTVTGGVRTGYTESGTNYAVKLDSNSKAYVNVPLASHTHTEYSSTSHSHSSFSNDLLINSLTCGRGNGDSTSNVAFGYDCFKLNSGTHNIAIGNEALKSNTTGLRNTAVGSQTFGSLTTTSDNTGIGYGALNRATGTENTCVGSYAGYLTTSGNYNTVIGSKAFSTNTAGYGNTILGASAGNALTSNFNVILGYKAAELLGASDNNTIVGYNTAQNLVSGVQNTVIGSRINTGDVSNHVFIGDGGGNIRAKHDGTDWIMNGRVYATGFSFNSSNMLLGSGAGNSITANATRNVAIGQDALRANVQGTGNVAIGSNALYASGGSSNISIGENSLNKYTGSTSIAIGAYALQENICDIGNIAIGYESLKMAKVRNAITGLISVTTGSTIVTGHSTLFLSELSVNAFIVTSSGYFLGQIGSIQSNTQLTLKSVSSYTLSFVGLNNPNVVFAYNLAIGNYSGNRISTGTNNFIIGSNSGKSLTTENNNLIIGSNTSTDNSGNFGIVNVGGSTGGGNTVIGSDLLNNIKISTNNNVFIGSNGTIRARYYGDTSKWEFIGPIQKLRHAHNSAVLITSGAIELDCSVYQSFWVHRTANITSINIINAQGPEFVIRIYFQSDSAGTLRTVSWPSSFRWMNATADTLTQTANRVDIMELSTLNNGSTWYVLRNRQNVSL
jgi:hypothetical protein